MSKILVAEVGLFQLVYESKRFLENVRDLESDIVKNMKTIRIQEKFKGFQFLSVNKSLRYGHSMPCLVF